MLKGGISMKMTGFAISMGVGVAAGAVTAMLLPRQSKTRKIVQRAAYAVEDAAIAAKDKIVDKLDM